MIGSLYVENTFLMSLTGGKEGVMRCHMSSETWEAVVKAVEELRVPLKPLLKELGVSKSSYYGKRSGSRYHLLAFEWLWVGIYAAIDVESRWAAYVEPYLWRSGASSVEFFMNASAEGEPEKLVTDKGSESISRDAEALSKVEGPESQGPPTSEYTRGQRTNRKVRLDDEARTVSMEGSEAPSGAKAESSGIHHSARNSCPHAWLDKKSNVVSGLRKGFTHAPSHPNRKMLL